MDLQMFQKHSLRTINKDLEFKDQLKGLALGMCGELGEVQGAVLSEDLDNLCEEIGDVCWYVANTCSMLGIDLQTIYEEPKGEDISAFFLAAYYFNAMYQDSLKKHAYHKHEIDKKVLKRGLFGVFVSMIGIMNCYEITLKEVLEGNQIKLMKRYPDGFESERSVNRDEQIQE